MANSLSWAASFWSVQALDKYFSTVVDGGVVMSRNLVNICRTVTAGNLSCCSHVFIAPRREIYEQLVITNHYNFYTIFHIINFFKEIYYVYLGVIQV